MGFKKGDRIVRNNTEQHGVVIGNVSAANKPTVTVKWDNGKEDSIYESALSAENTHWLNRRIGKR